MSRRGHGEGSIYQRSDGRYVASLTTAPGQRKYFYGQTRKEVQAKLRKAQRELEEGLLATGPQQTVQTYLETWLKRCKIRLRPNTYLSYRTCVNCHLLPAFGHFKLASLSASQIEAFYDAECQKISPNMVRLIHTVFKKALQDAVKKRLLPYNPCKDVVPPRRKKYEGTVLTLEQAQKLLEVAAPTRLGTLLLLALTTGMRMGELLALRWSDLDMEARSLHVRRTVSYISVNGHYEFHETEPKTSAGKRTILLPYLVIEALKQHRLSQIETRSQIGAAWTDLNLVFANTRGGYIIPNKLRLAFKKILRLAELPDMRFHDLRHSSATILLAMKVDARLIQERLGHSDISVTLGIYGHVLTSMQQEAMEAIDRAFQVPH